MAEEQSGKPSARSKCLQSLSPHCTCWQAHSKTRGQSHMLALHTCCCMSSQLDPLTGTKAWARAAASVSRSLRLLKLVFWQATIVLAAFLRLACSTGQLAATPPSSSAGT